ncbi:TetR/AcrR family transcriptional regulator [soil metagenome]
MPSPNPIRPSPKEGGGVARASAGVSKSEQTRERIIRAAAKVFRRKGYAGSTLADIATAAKTQPGSLYYHFESRDQIVQAVLERAMVQTSLFVRSRVDEAGSDASPLDRLKAAIRAHIVHVLALDDFTVAYERIIDQVPTKVRGRYVDLPRAYGQFIAGLIDDAVAAGQIRAEVSASVARLLLIGGITWMMTWYKPAGPLTPDQLADELLSIFLGGLTPR